MTDGPVPTRTLIDGLELPVLGLGTYGLRGPDGVDAVRHAIDAGYRLVDSAYSYENEGAVGRAVRRSGVPRDELVLTSKLPGRYHRRDDAVRAVHESLWRAGLDHWDLYLVHWPNPRQGYFVEAFATLLELRDAGLIRSVGVSNFLPEHLTAVLDATGHVPSVNQVELHPRFPQREQRAADEVLGVVTQSWSPLGHGGDLLDDPTVAQVARAHGVGPAEVILRWHTQLGAVPLPKSATPARQRANLGVLAFTLDDDEVAAITALGRPDGRMSDQDPGVYEEL
ncbi:aldo/keto reductase [Cellulomonas wangsupingiae]|uniref:Aldo/keto reductase n=1 Tax=Cellulomonas wangsupingiae TaxID=2968085 RepID=A0ABY5K049_9CELL|nr:aldo/keto reductase [Cellulomonas wangsupingiae]MCC2336697.1 aldo/keto reductase [Cellulomonas wangsupingiae]MCM0641457.1 aldo/keto reductase [Cellulomonas wangsupingiae]UUI63814.1 aldo/keto reductase [Cellulomonas wangsupingiae]